MSEPYPDLEIYLKETSVRAIRRWLQEHFNVTEKDSQHLILVNGHQQCECRIVPDAVGGFTSVWFKQNETPWESDLACARAASAFLNRESRCSDGSWTGEEHPQTGWIRVDDQGETPIEWDT